MLDWLCGHLQPVPVQADNVKFLHSPEEFYNTLIEQTEKASNRIVLASLYLGTGELERKLVTKIGETVENKNNVKVKILCDYLRGTRGGEVSSKGILKDLADKIEVFFFHTPDLRGVARKYLPERVNEVVGLQHMKFFIFDDSIIISGANLSDTYFTNRQDRYVLIENAKELSNFFETLFDAVSSCSFKLEKDGNMKVNEQLSHHPYEGDSNQFRAHFKSETDKVLASISNQDTLKADTLVYPFLQMGSFDINQEREVMNRLFDHDNDINVSLASGYLNLYDDYSKKMLDSKFPIDIVFASPEANGFHNAKGLSRYIPSLYVYISELFYRKVNQLGRAIKLHEYHRENWSFHGKGIWIEPKTNDCSATIIGSSNFGYRSTFRDLESQILIVTLNENLRQRMQTEKKLIMDHTQPLDHALLAKPDHYVPIWVKYFTRLFRNYF